MGDHRKMAEDADVLRLLADDLDLVRADADVSINAPELSRAIRQARDLALNMADRIGTEIGDGPVKEEEMAHG